jgi:hypothetical protein
MRDCERIVRRQFREWISALERALANPGPDQLTPRQIRYWLSGEGRRAKMRVLRAYWCA